MITVRMIKKDIIPSDKKGYKSEQSNVNNCPIKKFTKKSTLFNEQADNVSSNTSTFYYIHRF